MEQSVPVSLQELAVKCRSKKELYDLLCTSCDVYLPPIQFANASYVRGIVTGELNHICSSNVKHIHVPMMQSLCIEKIVEFALKKFDLISYLPKYRKQRLPDRKWLCNLVYSIVGQPFKVWINERLASREKFIVNKKKFCVKVLPKFAEAFKASNQVSTLSGRSHFLLRSPSRKRKKEEESKEIILSHHEQDIQIAELMDQVEDLKIKLLEFNDLKRENQTYSQIIEDLQSKGIIN